MTDVQIQATDRISIGHPTTGLIPGPKITPENMADEYFNSVMHNCLATTSLEEQIARHTEIGEEKFQEIIDQEGMAAAVKWMSNSDWQKTKEELENKLRLAKSDPDTLLFVQTVLERAFSASAFPVNGTAVISTEIVIKDGVYVVSSVKGTRGGRIKKVEANAAKWDSATDWSVQKYDPGILLLDGGLSVVCFHVSGKPIEDETGGKDWNLSNWISNFGITSGMFNAEPVISETGSLTDTHPSNPLYRTAYGMVRNPWFMLKTPLSSVEVRYNGAAVVTVSACTRPACKGILVERKDIEGFQSLFPAAPEHLSDDQKKRWSKERFQELHSTKCVGVPKVRIGKR